MNSSDDVSDSQSLTNRFWDFPTVRVFNRLIRGCGYIHEGKSLCMNYGDCPYKLGNVSEGRWDCDLFPDKDFGEYGTQLSI